MFGHLLLNIEEKSLEIDFSFRSLSETYPVKNIFKEFRSQLSPGLDIYVNILFIFIDRVFLYCAHCRTVQHAECADVEPASIIPFFARLADETGLCVSCAVFY